MTQTLVNTNISLEPARPGPQRPLAQNYVMTALLQPGRRVLSGVDTGVEALFVVCGFLFCAAAFLPVSSSAHMILALPVSM